MSTRTLDENVRVLRALGHAELADLALGLPDDGRRERVADLLVPVVVSLPCHADLLEESR
ncbi:hypothetical protein GCM10010172_07180 [Paractinoplanes ferrugineus]|uniref:Uncharacterized protein n=1 Tax=Paractinoplanes ferrugineus TaxID=113564 RepID=A0A919MIF7_9ACTN|nr:hypothetical protein [Actinoplanes ferrugineus]GIE16803.1 hypothetical protein Afe05nite_86430 [Actinoplanes ferrugineus]